MRCKKGVSNLMYNVNMIKLAKKSFSMDLLLDLFLLITTPIIFGPKAAVLFFFFYPLPATIFSLAARTLHKDTATRIKMIFNYASVASRLSLVTIVLFGIVNTNIVLPQYSGLLDPLFEPSIGNYWSVIFHILSQLFIFTLLVKTYNSYFSFKYNVTTYTNRLGVYVLEFYLFILAYICVIIVLQYLITI
ncbi:MAG: hypothetical protein ACI92I_000335 [Acidimicrobiales bacterium]|jgi:hypothetical protein